MAEYDDILRELLGKQESPYEKLVREMNESVGLSKPRASSPTKLTAAEQLLKSQRAELREPLSDEEREGFAQGLLRKSLGALQYVGETLDKPGRMVRGAVSALQTGDTDHLRALGNIVPFSDTLGITDPDDEYENAGGRQILERMGLLQANRSGLDVGDVMGFGAEIAMDPLSYLGVGIVNKVGQGLMKGGKYADDVIKAGKLAGDAADLGATFGDKIRRGQASLAEIRLPFASEGSGIALGTGEKSAAFADMLGKMSDDFMFETAAGRWIGKSFLPNRMGMETSETQRLAVKHFSKIRKLMAEGSDEVLKEFWDEDVYKLMNLTAESKEALAHPSGMDHLDDEFLRRYLEIPRGSEKVGPGGRASDGIPDPQKVSDLMRWYDGRYHSNEGMIEGTIDQLMESRRASQVPTSALPEHVITSTDPMRYQKTTKRDKFGRVMGKKGAPTKRVNLQGELVDSFGPSRVAYDVKPAEFVQNMNRSQVRAAVLQQWGDRILELSRKNYKMIDEVGLEAAKMFEQTLAYYPRFHHVTKLEDFGKNLVRYFMGAKDSVFRARMPWLRDLGVNEVEDIAKNYAGWSSQGRFAGFGPGTEIPGDLYTSLDQIPAQVRDNIVIPPEWAQSGQNVAPVGVEGATLPKSVKEQLRYLNKVAEKEYQMINKGMPASQYTSKTSHLQPGEIPRLDPYEADLHGNRHLKDHLIDQEHYEKTGEVLGKPLPEMPPDHSTYRVSKSFAPDGGDKRYLYESRWKNGELQYLRDADGNVIPDGNALRYKKVAKSDDNPYGFELVSALDDIDNLKYPKYESVIPPAGTAEAPIYDELAKYYGYKNFMAADNGTRMQIKQLAKWADEKEPGKYGPDNSVFNADVGTDLLLRTQNVRKMVGEGEFLLEAFKTHGRVFEIDYIRKTAAQGVGPSQGKTRYLLDESGDTMVYAHEVLENSNINYGKGMPPHEAAKLPFFKKTGISPEELSQLYFPKEVGEDLARMVKTWNNPNELKPLLRAYDRYMAFYKRNLTQVFPGFHVRNLFSGIYYNLISGGWSKDMSGGLVEARDIAQGKLVGNLPMTPAYDNLRAEGIRSFEDFRRKLIASGAAFTETQASDMGNMQELLAEGVIRTAGGKHLSIHDLKRMRGGDQTVAKDAKEWFKPFMQTGRKVRDDILDAKTVGEKIKEGTYRGSAQMLKTTYEQGEAIGNVIEDSLRIQHIMGKMRDGYGFDQAVESMHKWHFDYTANGLTNFERKVMRRAIPFYTFARNNTPLVLGELARNPGGVIAQSIRFSQINQQDSDFVPEYIGNTTAIKLPEWISGEHDTFIGGLGLPFEEPFGRWSLPGRIDVTDPTDALNTLGRAASDTLRSWGSQGTPAIQAPYELVAQESLFTGTKWKDAYLDNTPFGSPVAEWMIQNSPISRGVAEGRRFMDKRKSPGLRALDIFTGVKVNTVRDGLLAAELRELNRLWSETADISSSIGEFSIPFVPEDRIGDMSLHDKQMMKWYYDLRRRKKEEVKQREAKTNPVQ